MPFDFWKNQVNAKERFDLLEAFLKKHQPLWQPPSLGSYPKPLEHLPQAWVKYLENAAENVLFEISNYKCAGEKLPPDLPLDLKEMIEEIKDLIDFPFYHHDQSLLETDLIYKQQINTLNLKKSHELRNLGPLVKDFADHLNSKFLVDVGGGKGYLSLAASACRAQHIVIDLAEDLLNKCQGYFTRWQRKKELRCVLKKIDSSDFQKDCGVPQESLLVGLHLCGNLSVYLIKSVIENQNFGVVSIGCCYHRLDAKDQNLCGVSQFHLRASEYRLALAPYHYRSIETYRNSVIKNIYRFALYCIFREIKDEIPAMGFLNDFEYPVHAKQLDFEDFFKINEAKFEGAFSLNEAMGMLQDGIYQKAIDMEKYEFIRRLFSRVIEVYLILDRLYYLQKNNWEATVVQLFDGRLSPRNLGILGRLS